MKCKKCGTKYECGPIRERWQPRPHTADMCRDILVARLAKVKAQLKKVVEIGALDDHLVAERAKREALELEVESLVTDTQDEVKNGEWHTKYKTERARSAALEAEVKAEREAFVLFCDQQAGGFFKIGSFGSAVEMQKALTVFSQSPTEKKT